MLCIILCSHLFGKVSQQRATLTTTEARLLRRASYLRYNEPGGSCWLYVVNEKGIQHHAIFKQVMADSECQLLAYCFTCAAAASCKAAFPNLYMEILTVT